jgi:hypothetical protein
MEKNKLFLLEWKLRNSRVMPLYVGLWCVLSFGLLSSLLVMYRILDVLPPPQWFLYVWVLPVFLLGIKVRVTEYGEIIDHSIFLFSWRVWRFRTKVKAGVWEIDVISHRYRISKLSENGDRYVYPYRVSELPIFMFPVKVNESR